MARRETRRKPFRIDPQFKAVVQILAPKLRRQILIALGHGLATTGELAGRLGVPSSRVSYHLKRLLGGSLVEAHGKGRSRSYRLGRAVRVVRQKKTDVLTVSINKSRISISTGRTDKPPRK